MNSRWGAIYFVLYRFLMMDVLTAIIESMFLDAYARQEESRSAEELETRVARAVAGRLRSTEETGGGALTAAVDDTSFALRARADLLEELSAIEDAADASRGTARKGGAVRRGATVQGVSPEELEVLDAALRSLEASLGASAQK